MNQEQKLRSLKLHQMTPSVYPFAAFLGNRFGCTRIIDVGLNHPRELISLRPMFEITGVGAQAKIHERQAQGDVGEWIECPLDLLSDQTVSEDALRSSVIVCANALDGLSDPTRLLMTLRRWMNVAPLCILSIQAPKARRADSGASMRTPHERTAPWDAEAFEAVLRGWRFNVQFVGLTANGPEDDARRTITAVIESNAARPAFPSTVSGRTPPPEFRVAALMMVYNEEDIIVPAIERLLNEQIEVYIIDNWSTDATYDLARPYLDRGLLGLERFPADRPTTSFSLYPLLQRVEELTTSISADWFIHHDSDEIRVSPWPGLSLRDAIYRVDQAGFNCIDHTVVMFRPTDNGFRPGGDFQDYFKYSEFGRHASDFVKINAWKNQGERVSLAAAGGHEAQFPGRQIFPYKFLLKHYQVRSQQHGEKKVMTERKARWNPVEKANGWHTHYDAVEPGHNFLFDRSTLRVYEERRFNQEFLVERLTGIGAAR